MRVVLVPGVLALKPELASLDDPVADVRAAVLAALQWVGPTPEVIGDAHGVVASLLGAEAGLDGREGGTRSEGRRESGGGEAELGMVVVANGSAKRTEKAPGHFDERAQGFDDWLRETLTIDPAGLWRLDAALAAELWADVVALPALAEALTGAKPADFAPAETDRGPGRREAGLVSVDYDDDPYGVKYWVIRWEVSDA